MFSFTPSREGKFISTKQVEGPLACGKATKWKTCPIDWITLYAKDLRDAEQSNTGCTFDFSSTTTDTDTEVKPIEETEDVELSLVNDLRVNKTSGLVRPLTRSPELDGLAKWHVQRMANAQKVKHTQPSEVLTRVDWGTTKLGENVGRGISFFAAHRKMMKEASNFSNLVDPQYHEMGIATARGNDGKIYICQLFRG